MYTLSIVQTDPLPKQFLTPFLSFRSLKNFLPGSHPGRDGEQRGLEAATIVLDAQGARLVNPARPDPAANHGAASLPAEKQSAGHQDHTIPLDLTLQGRVPIYQKDTESSGLSNADSLRLNERPAPGKKRHGNRRRSQVLIGLISGQNHRVRLESDQGRGKSRHVGTVLGIRRISVELNRRGAREGSSISDWRQTVHPATGVMAIDHAGRSIEAHVSGGIQRPEVVRAGRVHHFFLQNHGASNGGPVGGDLLDRQPRGKRICRDRERDRNEI